MQPDAPSQTDPVPPQQNSSPEHLQHPISPRASQHTGARRSQVSIIFQPYFHERKETSAVILCCGVTELCHGYLWKGLLNSLDPHLPLSLISVTLDAQVWFPTERPSPQKGLLWAPVHCTHTEVAQCRERLTALLKRHLLLPKLPQKPA